MDFINIEITETEIIVTKRIEKVQIVLPIDQLHRMSTVPDHIRRTGYRLTLGKISQNFSSLEIQRIHAACDSVRDKITICLPMVN